MFDPRRDPPTTLFLSVPASDTCNYRCRHCHIWQQSEHAQPLTRARRVELVHEFSELSPQGVVVIAGGEVTTDFDELLPVAGACRERGLGCILLTNGSRIDTAQVARRIVTSGVTFCSVSLDSHREELHNWVRGTASAFAEATGAVRRLDEARRELGAEFQLIVTAVLFRENLEAFPELVELSRGLGADHIDFQVLARTFANRNPKRDPFFERHFWHGEQESRNARRVFRDLLARFEADGGFVVKKLRDLAWIERYLEDPDFQTAAPICGSHYANLIVDAGGDVTLCFNARQILGEPAVGNVRDSDLAEVWSGARAAAARETMDACRLNCGALNCHRRRPPPADAVGMPLPV